MEYYNTEQIKDEFCIDVESPKEIRKELIKRMAKIHPDTTKGNFSSKKKKEDYLKIVSAIKFLDEQAEDKGALIPVREVTDLIKTVKELIPRNKEDSSAEKLRLTIDYEINKLKQQNLTPKIATSGAVAILTFLWFFPSTITGHPILSKYIDPTNIFFTILWLSSLYLTAGWWYLLKKREDQETALKSRLNLKSVQNELLREYIGERKEYANNDEQIRFSNGEFIKFLMDHNSKKVGYISPFRVFLSTHREIDAELAEALADLILNRAEINGYIKKDKVNDIDEVYVINV